MLGRDKGQGGTWDPDTQARHPYMLFCTRQ